MHSMSELINAAMRVDRIAEHPTCSWKKFAGMRRDEDGVICSLLQ